MKAAAPASVPARDIANWATQDVLAVVHAHAVALHLLDPTALAELLGARRRRLAVAQPGEGRARRRCSLENKRPADIVAERGLAQVSDTGALDAVLDEVFAANADAVAEWRAGDDKVRKKKRGFLMGEAMKALKGQGNPKLLNDLLDTKLTSAS